MITSKETFLKRLVKLPELADNTIAFVFAANPDIDISSKERFFDNVISYFKRFKERKPEISQDTVEEIDDILKSWEGKDLRLKNVKLKSIRGFPQSDKPFGIDFTNNKNTPQSLIVLGGNGTGKSSVYDALEFSFCDSIGEALVRAYKEDSENSIRFMDFLEHNNNGQTNIFCHIETQTETFDIQNHSNNIPKAIRNKINPDTHFVSDYDIYTKGQLDYENNTHRSFHNVIAQSLGLNELLDFEKKLTSFTLYRRQIESRNVSGLKRSNENQLTLIDTNRKSIEEKRNTLDQLKKQQSVNPDDANIKEALDIISKVKQTNFQNSLNSGQFAKNVSDFNTAYTNLITKEVKNGGLNEVQFLNLGLELLKEHDDCPFCNSSNLLKEEISKNVNQRIANIKEFNEIVQSLTKTSNNLKDGIDDLINQTDLLRARTLRELSTLNKKVEFNELFLLDNSVLKLLTDFISSDLMTSLTGLNDNSNYLKDKNRFLYDIFKSKSNSIEKLLDSFINSIAEFENKRNEIIKEVELSFVRKMQPSSITEQIIIVTKEISDLERQIKDATLNIKRDTIRIDEILEQIKNFEDVKSETAAYLKVYHNYLNEEINKGFAPIKMVVEEVLEDYFNYDNRELELIISKQPEEIDEDTGEILSEIITAQLKIKNQNISPQSVNKYLNTFHYRLFCTMVGISIAIASRRNTQVNLPLVLDDIFYASDFENRSSTERFLTQIFNAFSKYTPDLPLQLILFTHDQLIFESAIKVVNQIKGTDIAFAKLFPHKEAHDNGEYLNLIYKFPDYFPKTIMNNLIKEI